MAQFLTLLPVLLLFALFNPIVCPSGQIYSERRDRAPYIESSAHDSQYLIESVSSSNRNNNPSYRNRESLPIIFPAQNEKSSNSNNNNDSTNDDEKITDSTVDKNIRSVFSTNFGPGLFLFKNTAPFTNQPHYKSYTDQMVGDQPDPYSPSSSLVYNNEFFKVQRSPNGKLTFVYNEDFMSKNEKDSTVSGSGNSDSLNNESFENRFQTHFNSGRPLADDKVKPSPPEQNRKEDIVPSYRVDAKDCDGANNGKPFCTHLRNYPEKSHLEQIIKSKFSDLESFFGEDLLLPQNISQRMNNEPIEEFLCRSRTRVIYPEAGLNKDYDWLFIINTKKYKQGVRIEECINEGATCGESTGLTLPNHYKATCKQSYIYRSLVAYTNETIIKDHFKMPSCCKCVLTIS